MMLGGVALPPLHPPCWPAVGRREISSASPFGRLLNHHWAKKGLKRGGDGVPAGTRHRDSRLFWFPDRSGPHHSSDIYKNQFVYHALTQGVGGTL